MSIYPIGNLVPAHSGWQGLMGKISSSSPLSPLPPYTTSMSWRNHNIADALWETITECWKQDLYILYNGGERRRQRIAVFPCRAKANDQSFHSQAEMTGWTNWWWQACCSAGHLCYFSWHGSGEDLIFLTFDHANLSPDTLFCIYILPVLLFKMCYKLQELS